MVKNRIGLLMASFFRKSIANIITMFLLFIFSSCLLNSFLNLTYDYSDNFDKTVEKLNAEDISFVYYNGLNFDQEDKIKEALDNCDCIKNYEIDSSITGNGLSEFKEGEITCIFSIISYDTAINKSIGKYEIIESIDKQGIYVSYLYKVAAGYEVGEKLNLRLNNNSYCFDIVGFYNNCTTGTINCNDVTFIATEEIYNEIAKTNNPSLKISVKIKDGYDFTESSKLIEENVSKNSMFFVFLGAENIDHIKESRYSNSSLFQAILSVGAIIMTIVLLIVVVISLKNYVDNNVKQLGTLKALGYSSSNLIWPIVSVLIITALTSGLLGCLFSYLIFPLINNALESQIGLVYTIKFLPIPFIETVGLILGITIITSYLSIVKIKTIEPINAIRDSKNVNKNSSSIVKLENSKLPLNMSIGLKGFLSSISRNIIIGFAITCVAFLAGFGVWAYQNVIKDNTAVIQLVCGQTADSTLVVDINDEDKLKQELNNNNSVESYYLYSIENLSPKNYPDIYCYVIDSSADITNQGLLLEGHLPNNIDEIAINGMYANKNNLKIGDKFVVADKDNNDFEFNICGITQGAYYTGRDCYILRDGFEKIKPLLFVSYYVDLIEDCNIDNFNLDISSKLSIRNYVNQVKYLQSTADIYCQILDILVVVICLLSILIVVFVLYVLIGILLKNKKREHGILKSLGFTSKDIILQTIVTIIPSCLIAIIIGLICSVFVPNLISLATSSIGMIRIGNATEPIYLIITGLSLLIFVIIYIYLLSRSIRKIAPHDLFNRE